MKKKKFSHHAAGLDTPEWMRLFGLEWMYRLAESPKRLWRFLVWRLKQLIGM